MIALRRPAFMQLALLVAGLSALVAGCGAARVYPPRVASPDSRFGQPNIDSAIALQMTSTHTGWLWWPKAERLSHGRGILAVARSTDQGRVWANVTPEVRLTGENLYFTPVGPETAFLAAVRPGKSVTVYVTHDGGRTWSYGKPILVKYGQSGVQLFSRGRDVWIEDGSGYSNFTPAQLFASQDGGISWRLVAETGSPAHGIGRLPDFSWVFFSSKEAGLTTGWVKTPYHSYAMVFLRTSDGGRTWTREPGLFWVDAINAPTFTGADGLAVVEPFSQLFPIAEFLRTTDGGKTWSYMHGVADLRSTEETSDVLSGKAAFASGMLGNIDSTTNGGRTWQTVWPPASASAFFERNTIIFISFATAKVGWAVISPKATPNGGQNLYLTTDGGRTWTKVAE